MRRGDSDVNFGQSGPGDLNCICKIDDKISIFICRIDYKKSLCNLNFLPSVDEVGPVLDQSCTQLLLLVQIGHCRVLLTVYFFNIKDFKCRYSPRSDTLLGCQGDQGPSEIASHRPRDYHYSRFREGMDVNTTMKNDQGR